MDRRQYLRARIDYDVGALAYHVRELEKLATDVRDDVRERVTLEHQAGEHPWLVVGLAVGTGLLLGRLL